MTLWWQTWLDSFGPGFLALWVFWVVFSICLHELGHGWAALRAGDRTPILLGHMTWNPLVHIPLPGWIMFFLLGITWGQMPVNPANFRRHVDEAIVALAGPAMNLGLWVLCVVVGAIAMSQGAILRIHNGAALDLLLVFCWIGAALNLTLLFLNLLPVPPLDGSRVVATFVRSYREFVYSPRGTTVALIVIACIFIWGGPLLFDAAFDLTERAMLSLAQLFGMKLTP